MLRLTIETVGADAGRLVGAGSQLPRRKVTCLSERLTSFGRLLDDPAARTPCYREGCNGGNAEDPMTQHDTESCLNRGTRQAILRGNSQGLLDDFWTERVLALAIFLGETCASYS